MFEGGQANRLTGLAREKGYEQRMVQQCKEGENGSEIRDVLV